MWMNHDYETIDFIIEVIFCLINTFTALSFVTYFHKKKFKFSKKFFAFFLVLSPIYIVFDIFKEDYISIVLTLYILNLLGLLIYSFTYKKSNTLKKAIVPFFYQTVFISANIVSAQALRTLRIMTYERNRYKYLGDYFCDLGRYKMPLMLLSSTLILLTLALAMFLYKKRSSAKYNSKIYNILLIFPFLSVIAVFLTPFVGHGNLIGDNFEWIYYLNIIVTPASVLSMYYLVYQTWLKNKLEKEKELHENMVAMELIRYEDIKNSSEQIRQIRHDIKNMLFSVKAEIDENNINNASQQLDFILDSVNSIGSVIETDNRTVDCIINTKLGSIADRNIQVSGDLSGIERIKDTDISIILGNVLDNAVEATNTIANAEIVVTFFVKGSYQNIICKNTVKGSVLENNPDFNTTKSAKSSHGFGIKSVKDVVSFYDGSVDFFEENNMFCVHVMLPI